MIKRFVRAKLVSLMLIGTAFGQIAPNRQAEIRHALKAQGYTGEMTAALKQIAHDHHWQTKSVPDSRVLILLGLGPKYPHLMNFDTAWTATPERVLALAVK